MGYYWSSTYTLSSAEMPRDGSHGYEDTGPQKTDTVDIRALERETTAAAIARMKTTIETERRYAGMASAINAIHAQHPRNGHPSRFIPETT